MRIKTTLEDGRTVEYFESFWTGRRELSIDGRAIEKIGRRIFCDNENGGLVEYTVKGSFIMGVTLINNSGEKWVLAGNKWYDWFMIFLPLIGIVFGVALCGALGAGLSVIFCMLAMLCNALITRAALPVAARIPIQILVAVVANGIWFGLYLVIAVFILALIAL